FKRPSTGSNTTVQSTIGSEDTLNWRCTCLIRIMRSFSGRRILMAKVITLSRQFPSYHPKAGQNTFFVEQVLNALGVSIIGIDAFQYFENLNPNLSHEILDPFVRGLISGIESEKLHTI